MSDVDDTRPTLDIAILNMGTVRADLIWYIVNCMHAARERGYNISLALPTDRPVCQNRNSICAHFLTTPPNHEALMMIDEDMCPTKSPFDLFDLMRDPKGGYDIIGWLSPAWRPDLDLPIYWTTARVDEDGQYRQKFDLNVGGMLEMDAVGSGVMMIARRVLEHPRMKAPFMDQWNARGFRKLGHDYNFCRRAKRVGFRVWVATEYKAFHARRVELLTVAKLIGDFVDALQAKDQQIIALGGTPLDMTRPLTEMDIEEALAQEEEGQELT